MFDTFPVLRRVGLAAAAIGVAGLMFTGCTTNSSKSEATATEQRQSLNSAAVAAVQGTGRPRPRRADFS
jgi:peptide deformylase